MKFGVREICDVVLRAKTTMKIGKIEFYKDEPVLYFDTLTTSSLEGSATTVYAQGGSGNSRLMAWEGERTLTFNMTDALISPESFSILTGADIFDAEEEVMYVHCTKRAEVKDWYRIEVPGLACWNHKASLEVRESGEDSIPTSTEASGNKGAGQDFYNAGADIFIMGTKNGEVNTAPAIPAEGTSSNPSIVYQLLTDGSYQSNILCYDYAPGTTVLVDYYIKQSKGKQIVISPEKFGGYFYLEASTLFRDEGTGKDLPAEFIIPRCKVQSNFTFSMAATGDPSTFDFVLDAFPDYTKFDQTQKVLAVIQVVEDVSEDADLAQRKHGKTESNKATAQGAKFEHKSSYGYGVAGTTVEYAWQDDTIATTARRSSITYPNTIPYPEG